MSIEFMAFLKKLEFRTRVHHFWFYQEREMFIYIDEKSKRSETCFVLPEREGSKAWD